MKITIDTKVKSVEVANFLIKQAILNLGGKPELMKQFMLSPTDLKNAETFRKQMVKSLIRARNEHPDTEK